MTPAGETGPPGHHPIQRLGPTTVARIAAGEVVERPASVVKELVENALDAGADRIDVRLEEGGRSMIEVADNGRGIPREELALAVERYATSKLPPEGPIERIGTLGFRGEALAAIAAVSRLRVYSRPPGAESAHGLSVVGGTPAGEFEVGRAPGTTVEVRDLFFATPARRKFLKSAPAEQVEVLATIDALYLARPSAAISLASDGRSIAEYPASDRLVDALARVLGPEFLGQSFPVDAPLPEGAQLNGVLGRPTVSRPGPDGLWIAINGRPVRSRTIAQAVRLAYRDHLPRTRFPAGALHLRVDPDRIDVNVHPAKTEVRLVGERDLLPALRRSVRAGLEAGPSVAENASLPVPLGLDRSGAVAVELPDLPSTLAAGPAWLAAAAGAAQRTLDGGLASVAVAAGTGRPGLRLVGPVFDLYWVAEAVGELWLIDQHAASERLLFDRLRSDGRIGRQELVEPTLVPLTARQRGTLELRRTELEEAGFVVEPFGAGTERVHAVPAYRGHTARPSALAPLLDELAEGGRATVPDGGPERIAASIACHAAVRGGDRISPEALRAILSGLDGLDSPAYACPHGRPIAVRWSRSRLDRSFLRRGEPG